MFSSSDGGFGGSILIPLISDPAGETSAARRFPWNKKNRIL